MTPRHDPLGKRFYRASAVVLLVTVNLVIAAPVWHQGNHPVAPAIASHPADIHLCGTGNHPTHPVNCPICLSQRLLTQTTTEAAPELSSPASASGIEAAPATPVTFTVSHLARPRAPPLI